MTRIIPYPPKNCEITFTEPFFRKEWSGTKLKYYIKASIDDMPEIEIRIEARQQKELIDYLIQVDKKLLYTVVRNDALGRFVCLRHSPASDFFDLVKEE